jgi:hypothetical protein
LGAVFVPPLRAAVPKGGNINKQKSPASLSASEPIRGLFIDGIEHPAGSRETFPVVSPGDGKVIAHTVNASDEDVDAAIASARRAFEGPEWRRMMSERTRAKFVYKLGDALEKHLDELYELETLNNGRPTRETRAQLSKAPDLFRYNAGLALAKRDAVIPVEGDYLGYTLRRPVGVVANVTPFNHPVLIAARNLAPTFASGCTTVVKPSEYTPLTTIRMWEIFREAGLPPGVFNIVTGFGASTGKALSGHPGVNKLVLTGGTESGRLAGAAAARNFALQTLELGGKAPVVVFDDFDVDQAVNYAAFGTFIGAGQTCICSSRHLVQRTIYKEFVEKLAAKAKSIRVGDPLPGPRRWDRWSPRGSVSACWILSKSDWLKAHGWSPGAVCPNISGIVAVSMSSRPCSPMSRRICRSRARRCSDRSRSCCRSIPRKKRCALPMIPGMAWRPPCAPTTSPARYVSPRIWRPGLSGSMITIGSTPHLPGAASRIPAPAGSSARRPSTIIFIPRR